MALNKYILFLLLVSFQGVFAQETIKTMFYNVFDFPSAPPSNRPELLKNILNTYQPDIFMICELENEFGADLILNNSLNSTSTTYSRAPYFDNQSGNAELQQLIFYKSEKFTLAAIDIITTTVRDINRYRLLLHTDDQSTNPLYLDIYVTHLKSSTGTSNQQLRLQMVTQLTNYLAAIDSDSYVIFAGDLNVYSASEPAYQHLLDPDNSITFADPIDAPGSWNNNASFSYLHTQSTRLSSSGFGGGAGGGLDDRFDFILISENMLDNPEMMYVENSYKAYGNNSNCFNDRIDSPDCNGVFEQSLRDNLYLMSDHLPVVMELQTDRTLSTSTIAFLEPITFPKGTITSDVLELKVSNEIKNQLDFHIYNVLGQQIKTIYNSNTQQVNIDVSGVAPGIYYLKVSPYNKTYKFIKR
ncbi:T9SS type A sorting domain-containing protein [uncultured Planktosalinus sp.]|uniref:T9SS type A sorting domain-containing protein n=1 Tax=uncultured Planktosalinus sp. TaxID=1810935 RepID=UPI0030D8718B